MKIKALSIFSALAVLAALPTPAFAKPKRPVVLLDFSRPTVNPAAATTLSSPELDAISIAMARQFTGGAAVVQSFELPSYAATSSMPSPASLGNPFVTYALSRQPFAPALAALPTNPLECAAPIYQPSFGFGRAAEERRRLIFPLVHRAACEQGLPVGLFDALIMQESRYQHAATSPKGAIGLAQLMPGTARQLGVDAYTLADNLRGGARYLKEQYSKFGRYDLALAAYNAGPGRVEKRWAVPNITETQGYVRTIMGNWTGVPPVIVSGAKPLPYRQAQLVFMPTRPTAR